MSICQIFFYEIRQKTKRDLDFVAADHRNIVFHLAGNHAGGAACAGAHVHHHGPVMAGVRMVRGPHFVSRRRLTFVKASPNRSGG